VAEVCLYFRFWAKTKTPFVILFGVLSTASNTNNIPVASAAVCGWEGRGLGRGEPRVACLSASSCVRVCVCMTYTFVCVWWVQARRTVKGRTNKREERER